MAKECIMWKPNQVPSIFSPFQLTNFLEESHPQHKDHFIDIRVLLETIEAMIKSSSSLGVIKRSIDLQSAIEL